jgi:hypothetical protein
VHTGDNRDDDDNDNNNDDDDDGDNNNNKHITFPLSYYVGLFALAFYHIISYGSREQCVNKYIGLSHG